MTIRASDQWMIGLLVLLAGWMGASLLVASVVAPAAFAVLPSRMLAGALVARVLPAIFVSGMAIGALTLARTLAMLPRPGSLVIASGILLLSTAAAQLLIQPRIHRVRQAMPAALELLESSDPRRVEFGRLHAMSLLALGVAMLCAAGSVWLCARLLSARSAG